MIRPVVRCPQCDRTMRAHCPAWRCGWSFCGMCAITFDIKTKRAVYRSY